MSDLQWTEQRTGVGDVTCGPEAAAVGAFQIVTQGGDGAQVVETITTRARIGHDGIVNAQRRSVAIHKDVTTRLGTTG